MPQGGAAFRLSAFVGKLWPPAFWEQFAGGHKRCPPPFIPIVAGGRLRRSGRLSLFRGSCHGISCQLPRNILSVATNYRASCHECCTRLQMATKTHPKPKTPLTPSLRGRGTPIALNAGRRLLQEDARFRVRLWGDWVSPPFVGRGRGGGLAPALKKSSTAFQSFACTTNGHYV